MVGCPANSSFTLGYVSSHCDQWPTMAGHFFYHWLPILMFYLPPIPRCFSSLTTNIKACFLPTDLQRCFFLSFSTWAQYKLFIRLNGEWITEQPQHDISLDQGEVSIVLAWGLGTEGATSCITILSPFVLEERQHVSSKWQNL